jgi:hypothetical protein
VDVVVISHTEISNNLCSDIPSLQKKINGKKIKERNYHITTVIASFQYSDLRTRNVLPT